MKADIFEQRPKEVQEIVRSQLSYSGFQDALELWVFRLHLIRVPFGILR